MPATGGCAFELDPEAWAERHDAPCPLSADDLDADGVWRCHRDAAGAAYCPFHRDAVETDTEVVAAAFLAAVSGTAASGTDDPDRQFVGARFEALPLSHTVLGAGNNHPIDLRCARIDGTLDLRHATVAAPLLCDAATIEGFNAHDCSFEHRVDARHAAVEEFDARSAVFRDRTNLRSGRFGAARLFNATFEERLFFRDATFETGVVCRAATFHGEAVFTGAEFGGPCLCRAARFDDRAAFAGVTFQGSASFEGTVVTGALELAPAAVDGGTIELRESRLAGGSLRQPESGAVRYDLAGATVGEIDLGGEAGNGVDLGQYRFLETDFDGFDFPQYTTALMTHGWRLHAREPPSRTTVGGYHVPGIDPIRARLGDRSVESPGRLRSTYLKAKNGASDVGDETAAAEFFRHEMRYRRVLHRRLAAGGSVASLLRWAFNWGYALLAGYGERPSRTVLASLSVILAFTGGYALVSSASPPAALGFSLQAFVGFLSGDPTLGDRFPLLGAAEAFLGTFLVALFVFTLTRSIKR